MSWWSSGYGSRRLQGEPAGLSYFGLGGGEDAARRTSRRVILKIVEAGIWLAAHLLTFLALLVAMVNKNPGLLALSAAAIPIYNYAIAVVHSNSKLMTARSPKVVWMPAVGIAMMFLAGFGADPEKTGQFLLIAGFLLLVNLGVAYWGFVKPLLEVLRLNKLANGGPATVEPRSASAGLAGSMLQVAIEMSVAGFGLLLSIVLFLSAIS